MKKVFALRGTTNRGKAQTIRTIDELLRDKYPTSTVEHEHRTRAEFRVVRTVSGVKIGIETTSTDVKRMTETFELFVNLGCEIIICATRTKGTTVLAVENLPEYDVVWLERPAQSDPIQRLFSNLAIARCIVEETEKIIVSAEPAAVLSQAAGR